MTASILDGKQLALQQQNRLKAEIDAASKQGTRPPALAVVLVGNDPASMLYVEKKQAACAEVGITSYLYDLPRHQTQADLLHLIDQLNHDQRIDGILVQLPLPEHIRSSTIIEAIKPSKDVDGLHPYNLGCLAQGHPNLRPCTPYGIIQLLHHYQLPIRGKHAVVLGASNIVGRPMALELLMAEATVTICHSQTQSIEKHIESADIVISATGKTGLVHPEWLHANQIIVDVGIHRADNKTVHGDIDFDRVKTKVAWITPVPGGVGPLTISTLLQNTKIAAQPIIRHA